MTMISMFEELANVEREMLQSPRLLTEEALERLDKRHEQAWNLIFAYEPPNNELRELMLLMLLDQMEDKAGAGESCVRIREKILSLFEIGNAGFANKRPCHAGLKVLNPS